MLCAASRAPSEKRVFGFGVGELATSILALRGIIRKGVQGIPAPKMRSN